MKSLLLASFLVLSGTAWSQDRANVAQKIVHIVDNSTVGAVQSVLGASHVFLYVLFYPMTREVPKVSLHQNERSEVNQINFSLSPYGAPYSLGLFQIGDELHGHEGGHSVASAALGPLYLPAVAVDYLLSGGRENSFFESWADMEWVSAPFFNSRDAEVGVGDIKVNGEDAHVAVFKFSLNQKQVMKNDQVKSEKVYEWLNTNIVVPLVQHTGSDLPPIVEFDLLKKTLNLKIDGRGTISTEQTYLHLENDPLLNSLHLKALEWQAAWGLTYKVNDKILITPQAGVGLSADLIQGRPTASHSLIGSLTTQVGEKFSVTGKYQKQTYLNGMNRRRFSVKASRMNVSVEYELNKLMLPDATVRSRSHLNFGVGIKF